MISDSHSDILPVPVESARPYLRVRPTTAHLDHETVTAHLRRLHCLTSNRATDSLLTRLRGPAPPTIEVLLVSSGGDDTQIEYYLGVDDETAHDTFTRTLRGLFPDSYEFTSVQQTDGWLRGVVGTDPTITGVEFHGAPERSKDWQTRLTRFETFLTDEHARIPLAAVIETMAATSSPMIYQALLRPKPDWSQAAEQRRMSIETEQDTLGGQLSTALFGSPDDPEATRSTGDQQRLEELAEKDTRRSFECTARAVAIDGDREIDELTTAFADVSHTCYEVGATTQTGTQATGLFDAICDRQIATPSRFPSLRKRPKPLVVDAVEAANLCIVDGDALTGAGDRALSPTPGEATALPSPPAEQLETYRGAGLPLGHPLGGDGLTHPDPVSVPPALQPMHVGWFGKTGSGKSTSLINAILANHAATDGADILIDPKGDGMAQEYLRAHYATYGNLENVLYFDCAEVLPAFSFFDIQDELDAGVPRATAVEDTVDHYIEILGQIMGKDRFDQAVRSPDIIRYLVKATFDPVNGSDAFSHRDLHNTIRQMHERQAAPAVADEDLERMLAGVVANRARSFDEIMQGVANRIEKIPIDQRLARIFNHTSADGETHFDLADYLDEDVVIIIDTGELRSEAQRVLTLVILSNLWAALRRRAQRDEGTGSQPLVNLYIEEAASIAVSDLLKQLLSQSRSFDCSVTLAMQFPAQLKRQNQAVYEELLNNISTFVTGNVAVDRLLTHRLATDEMDAVAVGNRLRALRRGQWLVSLPAAFDNPEPRPFLVRSLPLPPGDPAGDRPLPPSEETVFDAAIAAVEARTRTEAGLTLGIPSTASGHKTEDEESENADDSLPTRRVDSALPYTKRLPSTVEYDENIHGLRCRRCNNRYDPSIDGLVRAIECCSSLNAVDRDDIPLCDLNLKRTPEERAISPWSDTQLMFLQAVYNAQQLRYDPLEYDLLTDSMIRLQEYVGIDSDAVQDLLDTDVLRHDTDHPHRLYTVTPDGRKAIGESYRQGVDYGHGQGDLEESSQHVLTVEVVRRYLEQEYVDNPDSSVTRVVPYYDLDENHRLDLAALNAQDEFVVTVEVERINHDLRRATPEDFDKMAGCDPDEAIWVVMTQSAAHDVLQALNDPLDGPVRVEKTYAATTPPQQFQIDTPGLTAMYPVEWLRDSFLET